MINLRQQPRTASHVRRRRRSVFTSVAVLVAVALVAGCSGAKSTANPSTSTAPITTTSPSPTSSPTPSHPVPPTPLTYKPGDPDHIGAWIVVLPYQATTPQARQVLTDWTIAEQTRFQALNQRTIDVKTLNQISTGNMSRSIFQMITERRAGTVGGHHVAGGLFTVGQATVVIKSIAVTGRNATLEFCMDDRSYEVDTHGQTLIPPPGVVLIREKLILVKSKWLVSDQPLSIPNGCQIPKATS